MQKLAKSVGGDAAKWCEATQPLDGTGNLGTPGAPNTPCQAVVGPGSCLDPASGTPRPLVPPAAGQVFFTEVMADPRAVADARGEWLELFSTAEVDLNGAVLTVDGATGTGKWYLILYTQPRTTPPSPVLVVNARYEETYVKTAAGWKFQTVNGIIMAPA